MSKLNMSDWKVVSTYALREYPCGLKAGDLLFFKKTLDISTRDGKPTGESILRGTIHEVLPGVTDEPEVVWLRKPDGNRHTWDDSSIFDFFEMVRRN